MRDGKAVDALMAALAMGGKSALLAALPHDTASGAAASFPDGADGVPVKSLRVSIQPVQAGSGDPSPQNVRAISGRTGLTLSHSGENTSDPETTSVSWQSEAGTIYGGTLDVTTGVLTVDTEYLVCSGEESWTARVAETTAASYFYLTIGPGGYVVNDEGISSHLIEDPTILGTPGEIGFRVYNLSSGSAQPRLAVRIDGSGEQTLAEFKAYLAAQYEANTPVQFAYKITEPVFYQLTPMEVRTLLGENHFWADCGDVEVEYRADTTAFVEKKVAELQALILENG